MELMSVGVVLMGFVACDGQKWSEQQEDVPHDMRCYQDADGHTYDFAFGLNWQGPINDARVEKYGR